MGPKATGVRTRASGMLGRLGWLLPILVVVGCGASTLPAIHSEPERLAVARQMMARREWNIAIELLKGYISANAGSADVDEAIERLGECYLAKKDWPSAAVEFERLLRDYPESDSSGTASFRLGEALFGQARPRDFDQEYTHKALEQWQSYLRSFPGHWLNAEAERKIVVTRRRLALKLLDTARLYLKLKFLSPARIYYERVAQEYADTGLESDALLGVAMCDAKAGKKAEAIEGFKVVEERFAGQPIAARAAHERSRLER